MRGLLRALAVAAVGTGLVAGATQLPGRVDVSAPAVDGALAPARPVALTRGSAVCPGPQDLGVTGLPSATTVRPRVDLLAAAPPAAALPAGTAADGNGTLAFGALPGRSALGSALSAGDHDRGSVLTAYVGSPRSAVLDATGTLAPGVVALQRSLVNSGDGRGLITTACGPAAGESWLLGGGASRAAGSGSSSPTRDPTP